MANLTRTARSISETDLSRRIPVRGRDEVAQLATTFNEMLERLERAFGPSASSSTAPATSCARR